MPKSLNMNYVNCALIVIVLVLVVMCCMNKSNEGFRRRGSKRQARRASKASAYAAEAKQLAEELEDTSINPHSFRKKAARALKRKARSWRKANRRALKFR